MPLWTCWLETFPPQSFHVTAQNICVNKLIALSYEAKNDRQIRMFIFQNQFHHSKNHQTVSNDTMALHQQIKARRSFCSGSFKLIKIRLCFSQLCIFHKQYYSFNENEFILQLNIIIFVKRNHSFLWDWINTAGARTERHQSEINSFEYSH